MRCLEESFAVDEMVAYQNLLRRGVDEVRRRRRAKADGDRAPAGARSCDIE